MTALSVLDLSDSVAGAYCTKLLADIGADVVKVEPPTVGDPARAYDPHVHEQPAGEPGLLFWYLNANKRGVTLDVADAEGQAVLRRLLRQFDIVVESYLPARARELGLTYSALGADIGSLVWLSITPFGHTGPYVDYVGSDLVIQAASGWMSEGGEPTREPLQTGGRISEYITGTWGALAAMAAYTYRQMSGQGQYVNLAAIEAMQSASGYQALAGSSTGFTGSRRAGQEYPFTIVRCKNGWVGINILTHGQWEMLCQFMGRPDLRTDSRFATPLARREHADALGAIIGAWASQHTQLDLFQANEWRVPITLLPTVAQLLEFPQHQARGYFVEQRLGTLGIARQPGTPFQVAGIPFQLRRSAPLLGEHNAEIYRDGLGLTTSDFERLQRRGII